MKTVLISVWLLFVTNINIFAATIPNCRTPAPENKFGWCIPAAECKIFSEVRDISLGEFPEKYQRFISNSKCSIEPEERFCCILEHIKHEFATNNGLTNIENSTKSSGSEETTPEPPTSIRIPRIENVNRADIPNLDDHPNLKLLPDTCGIMTNKFRVAYGNVTGIREFPFMALLQYNREKPEFKCGGTLINEKYVLTAAHCVLPDLFSVRLGEHNINTENDCIKDEEDQLDCNDPVQDILIESATINTRFDIFNPANDIALLRLTRSANTSRNNVQTICLPTNSELRKTVFKTGQLSGWGLTEKGIKSHILLKAVLDVNAKRKNCEDYYFQNNDIKISDKLICATGRNQEDSCQGDSGGPLFQHHQIKLGDSKKYLQFGIVSSGARTECGASIQSDSLYVNVSRYMKWILDNIKE